MIVALPEVNPVTLPVASTVATVGSLEVHTPPVAVVPIAVIPLTQMLSAPLNVPASGRGVTVIKWPAEAEPQLVELTVYNMVTVSAAIAVRLPDASDDTTEVLKLLNTPPGMSDDSVAVPPTQRLDGPLIVPASGSGLTVIICVSALVPQLLVTE